jgi:hypothetical protein
MRSVMFRFADAVVVALVLAAGDIACGCSRPDAPAPPPSPSPAKIDQDIVDGAFHDCFLGNCERAYAHLSEVSPTSPLRSSDVFRAIQYRYDADRILRADIEPDPAKRRATYEAIANSPTTDGLLRITAAEHLAHLSLQSPGSGQELAINAGPDAGSAEAATREAADLLAKSRSKDPSAQSEARAKLEPKIYSGKASASDVAMLRNICRAQRDTTCLHQLERLILR